MDHTEKANETSKNKKSGRWRRALSVPFFAVLAALTLVAFIIPLRPTESSSEKRELAAFPSFSADALLSGDYFEDIQLWFSDTFPGRERWLNLGARISDMHGINTVSIQGAPVVADKIPDVPAKNDPTAQQVPVATPAPIATPVPVPSPAVMPESTPRPSPPPDPDSGMDVDWESFSKFGAVALIGDSAYEMYGFIESNTAAYGKLVESAAALLEDRSRVFSIVAPNSTGVVFSAEDYEQLGCSDQRSGIGYAYSFMDKATGVDIYSALRSHNSEYLYFRTDHHWTALAAWYAYEQWAMAAGFEPVPLSEYTAYDMGDYLGSFSRNYQVAAMKENPDRLYAYAPPGDVHMYIDGQKSGYEFPLITDTSGYDIGQKYHSFIYGDRYLTEIINNDIEDDSACLLVKDSYGNPFSVYLTQHYHRVIVIDCRFTFGLNTLVDRYGIDDVIFLNGLTLSQSDTVVGNYKKSIR